MRNEVIGTRIKIYRPTCCSNCKKYFEVDLELIDMEEITAICPWCDFKRTYYHSPEIESGYRIVRCE